MITISKIEVVPGGNTIYELPLKQPIYDAKQIDVEGNLNKKESLESITDFEKRLEYYNKNICSLSKFNMVIGICGTYTALEPPGCGPLRSGDMGSQSFDVRIFVHGYSQNWNSDHDAVPQF